MSVTLTVLSTLLPAMLPTDSVSVGQTLWDNLVILVGVTTGDSAHKVGADRVDVAVKGQLPRSVIWYVIL